MTIQWRILMRVAALLASFLWATTVTTPAASQTCSPEALHSFAIADYYRTSLAPGSQEPRIPAISLVQADGQRVGWVTFRINPQPPRLMEPASAAAQVHVQLHPDRFQAVWDVVQSAFAGTPADPVTLSFCESTGTAQLVVGPPDAPRSVLDFTRER
jgi:hypothetical protein